MTPSPLTRSWRLARVATAALALTAAALTVSGSATGGASTSSTPLAATTAPTGTPCSTTASAGRLRPGGAGGTDPNDVSLLQTRQAEAGLTARMQRRGLSVGRVALPRTTIDVYVHVIERSSGSGGVSTSRIKKQISVLNDAYAGKTSSASAATPFTFRLKKIDHTRRTSWYHWDAPTDTSDGDDVAPKQALHRGDSGDLNLYLASLDDDLLGYSTFPFDTTLARDGVVVLNDTLPGGRATGYDKGDTVAHEVGHWLGLYHTFQNGCVAPGDLVDDTPAQADGDDVFFCDDSDTCAEPGKDPVHNFMSYGNDKCLDRFSAGQVARMTEVWQAYRAPGAGV